MPSKALVCLEMGKHGVCHRWWLDWTHSKRALLKFTGWSLAYTLQLAVVGLLAMLFLHGLNLYPKMLSQRTAHYESGHKTWHVICQRGVNAEATTSLHVDCRGAFEASQTRPSLLALEDVLWHLLGDVNIFRGWLPSSQGASSYVVLKALDTLMGSTFLVVVTVTVLVLWFMWSLYRGPVYSWQQYQQYRAWENQPLYYEGFQHKNAERLLHIVESSVPTS